MGLLFLLEEKIIEQHPNWSKMLVIQFSYMERCESYTFNAIPFVQKIAWKVYD